MDPTTILSGNIFRRSAAMSGRVNGTLLVSAKSSPNWNLRGHVSLDAKRLLA